MPIEVYFPDDIANALRAVNMAGGMPPDLERLLLENNDPAQLAMMIAAYRHGHVNALRAVGAAFGIEGVGE